MLNRSSIICISAEAGARGIISFLRTCVAEACKSSIVLMKKMPGGGLQDDKVEYDHA